MYKYNIKFAVDFVLVCKQQRDHGYVTRIYSRLFSRLIISNKTTTVSDDYVDDTQWRQIAKIVSDEILRDLGRTEFERRLVELFPVAVTVHDARDTVRLQHRHTYNFAK